MSWLHALVDPVATGLVLGTVLFGGLWLAERTGTRRSAGRTRQGKARRPSSPDWSAFVGRDKPNEWHDA